LNYKLSKQAMADMAVFSARYCHNRNTGAALAVTTHIIKLWDDLDEKTKLQLAREAKFEATYNKDDWARIISLYEKEHGAIDQ
jgi:hypothetical protein